MWYAMFWLYKCQIIALNFALWRVHFILDAFWFEYDLFKDPNPTIDRIQIPKPCILYDLNDYFTAKSEKC